MSLQSQVFAPVAGFPTAGPALPALPANAAAGVSNAIGRLDAHDFFGAPGATGVVNEHGWRVDRQNAPAGFTNLSVQLNGVGAPSTVATVLVPTALNIAPDLGGPAAQPFAARIAELQRVVRNALEQSFASWVAPAPGAPAHITRFVVSGTFSA